jgi:uridine phosphorylase
MGEWSKWEFGREALPERAVILGGNTPQSSVDRIVESFGQVVFHKHDNYEPFIVESDRREVLLAFQVYGAPLVADLLFVLADGGVSSVIFVGAAYGRRSDLQVGDCVIPTKICCLDGFSAAVGPEPDAHPDPGLRGELIAALRAAREPIQEGPTVSVPSTFFHGDEARIPPEAIALEIEGASFLHIAGRLSMAAAAALVVSDTVDHTLRDDRVSRDERIVRVLQAIRDERRR